MNIKEIKAAIQEKQTELKNASGMIAVILETEIESLMIMEEMRK